MKRSNRRFFGTVALLGVVALTCSVAPAETYYVSLKGDDANKGMTEQAAFRTIKKGVSVLKAGDTLIIKSGDYGNERVSLKASGRKDAPITIKAEHPGKVVLTGSGSGRALSINDRSHVVVEGIKFTRYTQGVYIRRSSYTVVRKCVFFNNEAAGIDLNDGNAGEFKFSHHHLFTENQFLDYAESGKGSPSSGSGIQDYGVSMYFSSNVQVLNNYFYGHHHQCCSFKELMVNCRAAGNVFDGGYYIAIYLGQDINRPYKNLKEGVQCKNIVVEGNLFRSSRKYRLRDAVHVANVAGAVVRHNFMDSLRGQDGRKSDRFFPSGCIQILQNSMDVKVYGNTIINSPNPAIAVWAEDCEIYNNTIANCSVGLSLAKGVKPMVRNNIFYKNKKQVEVAEPLKPYWHKDYYTVVKGGVKTMLHPEKFSGKPVFQHNDWFPLWGGMGETDISVDPKFVGPFRPFKPVVGPTPIFVPDFKRAYAYRLKKTSPCIDRGVKTDLPFVGKAADIGAFEFGEKPKKKIKETKSKYSN